MLFKDLKDKNMSEANKHENLNNYLVWIDLEMTGLNAQKDVILEIATIITDNALNEITVGPEIVINHQEKYLQSMDDWVFKIHTKSGLIQAVQNSKITTTQAQEQILNFLKQFGKAGEMLLCGNSVWQDKQFLKVHMPAVHAFFHYRIIDVSTIKELMRRWYPKLPEFEKKDTHRAATDIRESIDELRYYRKNIFV